MEVTAGVNNTRKDAVDFSVDKNITDLELILEIAPPEILTILAQAKKIADLGSGAGNSAVALSTFCPNAEEIHLVDAYRVPYEENIRRLRSENQKNVIVHPQHIADFLSEIPPGSMDVIQIAAVPDNNHQLEKNGGYEHLGRCMSDHGIVVETNDTILDKKTMTQYFDLIVSDDLPERSNPNKFITAHRIWQKKT